MIETLTPRFPPYTMTTFFRLFRERCPLCKSHLVIQGLCTRCGVKIIRHPPAFSTIRSRLLFLVGAIVLGRALSVPMDKMGAPQLSIDRIIADCLVAVGYFLVFRWGYGYFQEISLIPESATTDRSLSVESRHMKR